MTSQQLRPFLYCFTGIAVASGYPLILYVFRYVPGTPGAPWSHQEVLAVKSKLYSIFGKWGANAAMRQIYDGNDPTTWMDVPNAAKMLRLGQT